MSLGEARYIAAMSGALAQKVGLDRAQPSAAGRASLRLVLDPQRHRSMDRSIAIKTLKTSYADINEFFAADLQARLARIV
jgi:hypothetical protein